MQDYSGHQIDRYQVISQLGVGGMAVVYKAYDVRLERDIALKLIRTDAIPVEQHERLLKRFEREAQSQAKFTHPNIVPVYDYGQYEDIPYLVLAYLPGGTLKSRIKGPTPPRKSLEIIIPICDALAYAHNLGVFHRDIKPSNILFDSVDRPILADFGIAKLLESNENTLTGTGLGVGTPEYMAPEQWQGKADASSDQYSLAVVLYELLTGKRPYTADTPVAIALKQMSEPLKRPSELINGLPDDIEKTLYKGLARNPQDRFATIEQFGKVLESILEKIKRTSFNQIPDGSREEITPADEMPSQDILSEQVTIDDIDKNRITPLPPVIVDKSVNQEQKTSNRKQRRIWFGIIGAAIFLITLLCIIIFIGNKVLEKGMLSSIEDTTNEEPLITEETHIPSIPSTPTKQSTTKPSTSEQEFTELSPTNFVTPTPVIYYPLSGCAGSQLHLGDSAFVSYNTGSNFLRKEPDTNPTDNIVGEIEPGEVIIIIDGPVCNYGWLLWKVQTTRNETGWTPETNGNEFWVLPLTTRDLCEGALPSRLVVAGMAKVMEEPDKANWVREEPGDNETFIGKIYPGEWMEIIDGPYCGGNTTWWKVKAINSGLTGWTMEGNAEYYYLVPAP